MARGTCAPILRLQRNTHCSRSGMRGLGHDRLQDPRRKRWRKSDEGILDFSREWNIVGILGFWFL